eukprot:334889-Prymnesium_polylepis.1
MGQLAPLGARRVVTSERHGDGSAASWASEGLPGSAGGQDGRPDGHLAQLGSEPLPRRSLASTLGRRSREELLPEPQFKHPGRSELFRILWEPNYSSSVLHELQIYESNDLLEKAKEFVDVAPASQYILENAASSKVVYRGDAPQERAHHPVHDAGEEH